MKFNISENKFCGGERKMVSMRLPETLMKEIKRIAERKNRDMTDIVMTVLDQYAQFESKNSKKK